MGSYVRTGSESPTPDEVKKGYASAAIRGTPFAKFLFWTFAGLAASYAVTYGVVVALDKIQEKEDQRFAQMVTRAPEHRGIHLQPSPGHDIIDWVETNEMYDQHNKDLRAKGWEESPTSIWKTKISDSVLKKTEAAIKQQATGAAPAAGSTETR
jgi:hypothetical protein